MPHYAVLHEVSDPRQLLPIDFEIMRPPARQGVMRNGDTLSVTHTVTVT